MACSPFRGVTPPTAQPRLCPTPSSAQPPSCVPSPPSPCPCLPQHWDGLRTKQADRVLVLAATNRPMDLDDAVIRRMPRRIFVPLPDAANRERILQVGGQERLTCRHSPLRGRQTRAGRQCAPSLGAGEPRAFGQSAASPGWRGRHTCRADWAVAPFPRGGVLSPPCAAGFMSG